MIKLQRARSLLYRRPILQANIRWTALDEIHKIYMLYTGQVSISKNLFSSNIVAIFGNSAKYILTTDFPAVDTNHRFVERCANRYNMRFHIPRFRYSKRFKHFSLKCGRGRLRKVLAASFRSAITVLQTLLIDTRYNARNVAHVRSTRLSALALAL